MELNTNNVNIEDLKKMATMIAMEQANKQPISTKNLNIPKQNVHSQPVQQNILHNPKQNIAPQPKQSIQKKVTIVTNTSDDVANIVPLMPHDDGSVVNVIPQCNTDINDDSFAIMGICIPKYTLYLIIVLIIIAVVIWYMSKDNKLKKKNKDDDE